MEKKPKRVDGSAPARSSRALSRRQGSDRIPWEVELFRMKASRLRAGGIAVPELW